MSKGKWFHNFGAATANWDLDPYVLRLKLTPFKIWPDDEHRAVIET